MRVLVDTSFLVSLVNPQEKHHAACAITAQKVQAQLVVPASVIPEAAYLIHARMGHRVMRAFIEQMQQPTWEMELVYLDDLARSSELLDQYADNDIDFVDTTIIAIAERLKIHQILTLDRRHFSIIRPRHTNHFELLPTLLS